MEKGLLGKRISGQAYLVLRLFLRQNTRRDQPKQGLFRNLNPRSLGNRCRLYSTTGGPRERRNRGLRSTQPCALGLLKVVEPGRGPGKRGVSSVFQALLCPCP